MMTRDELQKIMDKAGVDDSASHMIDSLAEYCDCQLPANEKVKAYDDSGKLHTLRVIADGNKYDYKLAAIDNCKTDYGFNI